MSDDRAYALFHTIDTAADARVRREIVARGLKPLIDFRNAGHYDDHRAELRRLGGTSTPALWDGERLHEGEAAVLRALRDIIPPQDAGEPG